MKRYQLTFGSRHQPRLVLDVMAPDSLTATQQHLCLCLDGERLEVRSMETMQ